MKTLSKIALVSMTMVGTAAVAAPDAPKAPAPPAAMTPPKPPKEIADWAKMMAGTWNCKGQGMGPDMKMAEMNGKMSGSLDKQGFWYHSTFASKMGKDDFHLDSYATYDGTAKKYRVVMVMSDGGYAVGTSEGPKGTTFQWDMDTQDAMGAGQFRDHIDWTDAKAGTKVWGEMSMDKGKTWMKVYEMTCKK